MEISLAHQFVVLLSSIAFGMLLGLLYDCVRIVRCLLGIQYKRPIKLFNVRSGEKRIGKIYEGIVMGITDLLYFIIAAVIMSVFVYFINNGKVRWYIYSGSAVGFALYYFTIGRIVISLSSIIAYGIRKGLYIFLICLYEPVRPLFSFIKNTAIRVAGTYRERKALRSEKQQTTNRKVLMEYGKHV